MRSILIVLSLMFLTLACSKQQREDAKAQAVESISTTASEIVALPVFLDCSNVPAIKADFKKELEKVSFLEPKKKSMAAAVCREVVEFVVPKILTAPIPEEWECKNTVFIDLSKTVAEKACQKL